MDTPNCGFSLFQKFPTDILAGIMFFIPGEDIGRLKITGSKSLWSILTSPNVVKSVILGEGGIRFQSWPSFMNEFPSLESLRIESHDARWWSNLNLTINQLPSTLRNLYFRIEDFWWPSDRLFQIPTGSGSIHLDEHLPHLEVLELIDYQSSKFDWVSRCPSSLTSLEFYQCEHDLALPASLIRFNSMYGSPAALPCSLESLTCEHYFHSLPCLTSLSASLGKGELVQLEDVLQLPQSLTYLDVYNHIFPSEIWSSLPHNLQSLSLNISGTKCTETSRIVDPLTGEVHQVVTCPIEQLPKSLTKLKIEGVYDCCLFVSGSCSSLFPPHLTSFDAECLRLAPNAAKQLPPSLTHLATFNYYEQLGEHLPQGLRELTCAQVLLSPKTIKCLPKSLTKLKWHLFTDTSGTEQWFDYTTGKIILSSSLPESFVCKGYASYFACLPPNLTSVQLSNFGELQDDFIQNQIFSNLLSLSLWKVGQLSDHCIPLLNRHLITLDVNVSPNITGKCFKSLPKSLTFLSLGSSSSIDDEDIQHLPRALNEVWISSAARLSNACIRDFPRCCKRLDISSNQKITQLCIPDLPPSLTSLFVASWKLSCGDVTVYSQTPFKQFDYLSNFSLNTTFL